MRILMLFRSVSIDALKNTLNLSVSGRMSQRRGAYSISLLLFFYVKWNIWRIFVFPVDMENFIFY